MIREIKDKKLSLIQTIDSNNSNNTLASLNTNKSTKASDKPNFGV